MTDGVDVLGTAWSETALVVAGHAGDPLKRDRRGTDDELAVLGRMAEFETELLDQEWAAIERVLARVDGGAFHWPDDGDGLRSVVADLNLTGWFRNPEPFRRETSAR